MDIETYTENTKIIPYCICVRFEDKYYSFYGENNIVIKFLEKICEISDNKYIEIFTHNVNFDGLIILEYISKKYIIFDFFARENNIYWIKIKYIEHEVLIRCSYKILPLSVKKIGELLNYNKDVFPYKFITKDTINYRGKIPNFEYFNSYEDYSYFISNNTIFDTKLKTLEYCFKDVEIVYNFMKKLIKIIENYDNKIIKKSYSFSSISYKLYIKMFDKWEIDKIKNTNYDHNYIKDAYYGGRCEVFGNPNDKLIHYFDFSGMYSQCMKETFPIGKPSYSSTNLNIYNIGFHSVKIKVNDYLPFLPYKSDKLLFPNGIISGRYWYEELVNAVKMNKCEILEHYSSMIYEKSDYIFKDFVDYFTNLRKNGIYYNTFGKNINNGLYGSFALNEESNIYIICHNETEMESYLKLVDVIDISKIGNSYLISIEKTEKSKKIIDKDNKWKDEKKRNIAYAAIIASKARIKLNNSLQKVIDDGGELYYTDTDSIFAGYSVNKINEKLGEIKWSKVYKDAVFISSKFYCLDDETIKIKGVNNQNYSFKEIKDFFYNNKYSLKFKDQLNIGKKDNILIQKYLDKEILILDYKKRVFTKDKFKTNPILIPDK